ncbi:peroxidase 60-like protein [Tanacetum coccineum]
MANMNSVAFAFILLNLITHSYGALEFGFYNGKCQTSDVEDIVRRTVATKFFSDRTITPALLRMQFHDCFVNGDVKFIEEEETEPNPTMPNPNLIMSNSPTVSPFLKDFTVHIPYTQKKVFEYDEISNHVGDKELISFDGIGNEVSKILRTRRT